MCCDWLRATDAPIMKQSCEFIAVRVVTALIKHLYTNGMYVGVALRLENIWSKYHNHSELNSQSNLGDIYGQSINMRRFFASMINTMFM